MNHLYAIGHLLAMVWCAIVGHRWRLLGWNKTIKATWFCTRCGREGGWA